MNVWSGVSDRKKIMGLKYLTIIIICYINAPRQTILAWILIRIGWFHAVEKPCQPFFWQTRFLGRWYILISFFRSSMSDIEFLVKILAFCELFHQIICNISNDFASNNFISDEKIQIFVRKRLIKLKIYLLSCFEVLDKISLNLLEISYKLLTQASFSSEKKLISFN